MLTLMLQEAADTPVVELHFEHSLVSLSKWESIHEKAFFGQQPKTPDETISYVEQMLLTPDPPEKWLDRLSAKDYMRVNEYINSKQTATYFREEPPGRSNEVVTAELVYYWMISLQIPFECDKWHFNRLMTLIRVCGVKQTKPKKMSKQALAEQYRQLNAQRRQELGTSG